METACSQFTGIAEAGMQQRPKKTNKKKTKNMLLIRVFIRESLAVTQCKCLCEQHKLFPLQKNVWLGSHFCSFKHFTFLSLTLYCSEISCAIIGGITLVILFFFQWLFSNERFFDKLYRVLRDGNTEETKGSSLLYHWSALWEAVLWLADAQPLLHILLMEILH